jgi:membrane protease YdiL (CAAX protease family)
MSRAIGAARLLAFGALAVFPLVVLALWAVTPLELWESVYVALLAGLMPALAVAQLPAVEGEVLPRVPVYVSSGVVILVLGLGGLVLGSRSFGMEAIGLGWVAGTELMLWTLGLSLAAVFLIVLFYFLRKAAGLRESPLLLQLLPETSGEKAVFVFLSLAAGFGEELAYRGFLIPALALLMGGEWVAALVSSVIFGTLHAYQGWVGIVRTAALGLMLASTFLISGSLWPAIFAHAILDIVAGLVIGEALVKD